MDQLDGAHAGAGAAAGDRVAVKVTVLPGGGFRHWMG